MKLIAIMPVRNEAWVLGLSARAALQWCDELVILDHLSTDGTFNVVHEIAREHPCRVRLICDRNSEWQEMRHRQSMLEVARHCAATHIAIVDADEILTGNLLPTIRQHIEALQPGAILQLPIYNLRGGIDRYHSNGIWGNRPVSVAFRDDGRATWQGDQFHHREPFNFANSAHQPLSHGQGGVMHLWGSDERRLVAKHALYKMTERLRWPHKEVDEIERLYNLAICGAASLRSGFTTQWEFAAIPGEWWAPYRDLMPHLKLDAEPWQERECERLLELHGAETFQGLDLFGVGSVVATGGRC